uniref:Uncharacterized protein n=1 Tax=Rhizophora mucronata TaxID=61149 RepID=A0A2P2P8I5_RHIMU
MNSLEFHCFFRHYYQLYIFTMILLLLTCHISCYLLQE